MYILDIHTHIHTHTHTYIYTHTYTHTYTYTPRFAQRADLILILFDAHKLDISDEFRAVLDSLKGTRTYILTYIHIYIHT